MLVPAISRGGQSYLEENVSVNLQNTNYQFHDIPSGVNFNIKTVIVTPLRGSINFITPTLLASQGKILINARDTVTNTCEVNILYLGEV